jgi:hypothetical protein
LLVVVVMLVVIVVGMVVGCLTLWFGNMCFNIDKDMASHRLLHGSLCGLDMQLQKQQQHCRLFPHCCVQAC